MKISIVTAVYNRESVVEQCIASLNAQVYEDIEHVIIDGGSSDKTVEIVNKTRRPDSLFVSESDDGIYDALNKGIGMASGEVIGILHSDDFFTDPAVLSDVAAAFSDPSCDGVYGDLEYVSKEDRTKVIRRWEAKAWKQVNLKRGWMPPHPALFLRRSVYDRVGLFDLQYQIAADYDFILRSFSQPGFVARYLPRVLVRMRVGGESNRSIERIILKSKEDYAAIRGNRVGGLTTLALKNFSKIPQFLK